MQSLTILLLLLLGINAHAMLPSEPKLQDFSSNLSSSKINIESLINIEEKNHIELHFFWATGRPYELIRDEYNADRTVHIGGQKWAGKWKTYIVEFLEFVPTNIHVVFVCDQLTRESNEIIFNQLCKKFGDRFKVIALETLIPELIAALPFKDLALKQVYKWSDQTELEDEDRINQELKEIEAWFNSLFEQAFFGNPAITSDIYRIIGMPIVHLATINDFSKIMWTYSDIDTFCYALEHEKIDNYLKSILKTSPGTFYFKPARNNDVIKLGFSNQDEYKKYVTDIMEKLYSSIHYLQNQNLNTLNYLQIPISYLRENDFDGYMNRNIGNCEILAIDIIKISGPWLANNLGLSECLDFPTISTLEWNPTYTVNVTFASAQDFVHHIDNQFLFPLNHDMSEFINKYVPHVHVALALKIFGTKHPFNQKLLSWLKENNPYLSKEYKNFIDTIINYNIETDRQKEIKNNPKTYEEALKFLEESLLKMEQSYDHPDAENNSICFFFKLRKVLRTLGIEFPILPHGN